MVTIYTMYYDQVKPNRIHINVLSIANGNENENKYLINKRYINIWKWFLPSVVYLFFLFFRAWLTRLTDLLACEINTNITDRQQWNGIIAGGSFPDRELKSKELLSVSHLIGSEVSEKTQCHFGGFTCVATMRQLLILFSRKSAAKLPKSPLNWSPLAC